MGPPAALLLLGNGPLLRATHMGKHGVIGVKPRSQAGSGADSGHLPPPPPPQPDEADPPPVILTLPSKLLPKKKSGVATVAPDWPALQSSAGGDDEDAVLRLEAQHDSRTDPSAPLALGSQAVARGSVNATPDGRRASGLQLQPQPSGARRLSSSTAATPRSAAAAQLVLHEVRGREDLGDLDGEAARAVLEGVLGTAHVQPVRSDTLAARRSKGVTAGAGGTLAQLHDAQPVNTAMLRRVRRVSSTITAEAVAAGLAAAAQAAAAEVETALAEGAVGPAALPTRVEEAPGTEAEDAAPGVVTDPDAEGGGGGQEGHEAAGAPPRPGASADATLTLDTP